MFQIAYWWFWLTAIGLLAFSKLDVKAFSPIFLWLGLHGYCDYHVSHGLRKQTLRSSSEGLRRRQQGDSSEFSSILRIMSCGQPGDLLVWGAEDGSEGFYCRCTMRREQLLTFQGSQRPQTGEGDRKLQTDRYEKCITSVSEWMVTHTSDWMDKLLKDSETNGSLKTQVAKVI